jgi:hypothetical protein
MVIMRCHQLPKPTPRPRCFHRSFAGQEKGKMKGLQTERGSQEFSFYFVSFYFIVFFKLILQKYFESFGVLVKATHSSKSNAMTRMHNKLLNLMMNFNLIIFYYFFYVFMSTKYKIKLINLYFKRSKF